MVHFDDEGIIDGLWRGEMKCVGPKAKGADLWIPIWEVLNNFRSKEILIEVEHVKAHRRKGSKCRSSNSSSLEAVRKHMSWQKRKVGRRIYVSAMYSWSMEAWRMFFHASSLWNDARLVVWMLEVLAILRDTKDGRSNLDAGCIEMTSIDLDALDVDALTNGRIQRCFQGFWRQSGF